MSKPFDTLLYFIWAGLSYGTLTGILAGTMMYPVIGTLTGLVLGSLGGAYGGFIIGLLVMLYNAFFLRYDTEHTAYRRRLTLLTGILTAPIMFGGLYLVLLALIHPFYDLPDYETARNFLNIIMLLYGAPAVIVASMAAAYATHHYADWHIGRITKRKNEDVVAEENHPIETGMKEWYLRQFYRQLKWGFPILGVFGLFILLFDFANRSPYTIHPSTFIASSIAIAIGGIVYSLIITPIIAALNILLIKWLNRLVFQEYFPRLAFKYYRRIITLLAGLVTLICTPFAAVGIGVPVATLIAGRVAWLYAGEFYLGESADKDKRKAAEAAAYKNSTETIPAAVTSEGIYKSDVMKSSSK